MVNADALNPDIALGYHNSVNVFFGVALFIQPKPTLYQKS